MITEVQQRLEPFSFNDQEPAGLTSIDGFPGEAGSDWADVWSFQLPAGYTYIYDRSSVLSAYLAFNAELVDAALLDDGGQITDDTIDARDAGADDVAFVPAVPAADDAYYFGSRFRFQEVTINFGTAGAGSTITWVWEYWDGSAWTALAGLSANSQTIWQDGTGNQTLSFTLPSDWSKTLIGHHQLYFVRARISVMTTNFTTVPLGTQINVNGSVPEIANDNMVRVVWTDPNEEEERRLAGQVRYQLLRDFQQDSKLHRMDIGSQILIPENYFIKLQVKTKGPVDASASYFNLVGHRTRMAIF